MACLPFLLVRLAAHVSSGCKSRIRPVVGRIQPKARVLQVTANLKEAGCGEPTNPRANLWSDGQKPYRRLCMRVSLQAKMKLDSCMESCTVDTADGWRERNECVSAPLRSVQNKRPLDALHPREVCTEGSERSNHY